MAKSPKVLNGKIASVVKVMVEVFEKYGFYWLGHDRLEDTMHFEFLGQPELIEKVISGSE